MVATAIRTTVMATIESRLRPFVGSLRGRFMHTMPLLIGGVPKLELIEQVKAVRMLGSYAESMIRHEAFTTLAEQELAPQMELLVEDLGFTEEPPCLQHILKTGRFRSEEHT